MSNLCIAIINNKSNPNKNHMGMEIYPAGDMKVVLDRVTEILGKDLNPESKALAGKLLDGNLKLFHNHGYGVLRQLKLSSCYDTVDLYLSTMGPAEEVK